MTRVINSPCAASRALVCCVQYSSQSGFIDKPCSSQSTCARVRVRERLSPIRDHEAYFRAWRVAKFGGDFDPIRVAVDEAVRDFGSAKDFTLWAWYANRIGVNNFLELYFEQKSIMRECRLRNPAAAFHARPKPFGASIFDNWSERGRLRKRRRPQTSKEAASTFGVRDCGTVPQR